MSSVADILILKEVEVIIAWILSALRFEYISIELIISEQQVKESLPRLMNLCRTGQKAK